jgi:Protein-tyrosine-phosphatase
MFKKQEKKLRVLFVDEKNTLTSQLAEYFTRSYFGKIYEVYSAGPEHDIIDCEMISVMYQKGEDMRRQISKDFRNQDDLPADAVFDIVVYLREPVFKEWSGKTPWKGKQILFEMGTTADFNATDDLELANCYSELIERVRTWVKENMGDVEKLRSMVSA